MIKIVDVHVLCTLLRKRQRVLTWSQIENLEKIIFFSKCVATTNCYLYVLNTHVAIRCDDLRPTNKRKGFKIPSMERKLFPKILRVILC